jgi:hypothetical protein
MSFDLYFLDRRPGESWEDAMERLEEESDSESRFDEAQIVQWDRIKAALSEVLPGASEFVGEGSRELSDESSGIQISWYGDELSLTVPYWHSGDDADRMVSLLQRIVGAVESITGRTAYDPQAEAPFLGAGAGAAADTFDRVARSFGRDVTRAAAPGSNDGRPPGFFKRVFGRG